MWKISPCILLFAIWTQSQLGATNLSPRYGLLPLEFEPNHGQVDDSVKFLCRGSGYELFLTPNEAVLEMRQASKDSKAEEETNPGSPFGQDSFRNRIAREKKPQSMFALRMKLQG